MTDIDAVVDGRDGSEISPALVAIAMLVLIPRVISVRLDIGIGSIGLSQHGPVGPFLTHERTIPLMVRSGQKVSGRAVATLGKMLRIARHAYASMIGHAYDGLPNEACGLTVGPAGLDVITTFYPCANAAGSSKLYEIDGKDFLRVDRLADDADEVINGVVHSHTHTDAYPSPTDVNQAPDPTWHYLIVSLRDTAPVLRSYRIVDGNISEEPIVVTAT